MFGHKRGADDFAEEIRSHLELEADELKGEGLSDAEAQRRARVAFGSVSAAQERFNLRGRVAWLENFWQDVRFALRQLRRRPGFAVTAVLILALGMGVSVAIFGFVDAALLEPLPYAQPNRLMAVNEKSDTTPLWPLSYPDFLDWQRMNQSFRSMDIFGRAGFLLRNGDGTEPVMGGRVSEGFFRTLGVQPFLGRDFNPGEDRLGGPNVTILSYGAWLHRFGARRDVIGQTVGLDGQTYTVIGVLPRSFNFALSNDAEFWTPINTLSLHEHSRTFYDFIGIGRLRNGVTPQAAQGEMTAIAKRLLQQYGITGRTTGAQVMPLAELFTGNVRPILLMLLAGAALLLLIACVNVASLLLVRSESRRREVAVRGALGATRARLMGQFVTEGLILAGLGCACGVLLALSMMRALTALIPKSMAANMPFMTSVGMNAHTGLFAAAIATLTALLLAATPALRLGFEKLRDGLAEGERGSAGRFWRRLGANMVIVELAVAVVLLAGAGLLGKSLYRLLHVDVGFTPEHLATLRVTAPGTVYATNDQMAALSQQIEQRVTTLPGVESVGMTSLPPVDCDCSTDRIEVVGRPDNGEHNEVDERHISPGYLHTLGARLVRGRFFTADDLTGKPNVAVINESLARMYFPGQDPIGQKIADDEGGLPTQWQIVGVVSDVHEGPLDAVTAPAEYFPLKDRSFVLMARTGQDAGALLPSLVSTMRAIDPNLAVADEATMTQKISGTQSALLHRLAAWLVGGFAAIALVLGVVGLYGVIAYSVSQRTREIGVRMALGAQRGTVYRMVMRQAGWLTVVGLAVGLAGAVGASVLIRKLLFGVSAWDVPTLAAVALLLGVSSLVASFLPARRAASVNPTDALRAE